MADRIVLNTISYHGHGAIENIVPELTARGYKKAFVCSDPDLIKFGVTGKITALLDAASFPYAVYSEIKPNPTIQNVQDGVAAFKAAEADCIVTIGGGSSMDCAKAAGARIVKPHQSIQQMKGLLKVHKRLPLLIAIPTTAGTGSETTLAAVITDSEQHYKYPINDFVLIPRYAVLDYHETVGLPANITATTGMDALTHAVEAYIGGSTTKETRAIAEEAVCLIHEHLKNAYDNGHNKEARKGMLRAAYCAGVAFTKSYVGYIHAVAHSLGGQYGTPHGLANAVILPIVLRIYGPDCEKKLGTLARNTGVAKPEMDDAKATQCFIDWIQKMNDSMGIPRYFPEICKKDIPIMAKHADKEANPLYPVPVLMDRKELEKIYLAVRGKTW